MPLNTTTPRRKEAKDSIPPALKQLGQEFRLGQGTWLFTENHCTIPGFTLRVTAGHKALKEHGLKSRDLFASTMISGNTFPKEGMMGSSHGAGSQNPRLLESRYGIPKIGPTHQVEVTLVNSGHRHFEPHP